MMRRIRHATVVVAIALHTLAQLLTRLWLR